MSYVNPRFRLPLASRQSCEPTSPKRQIDGKLEVIYCVGGVTSPVLANVYLHYVLDLCLSAECAKAIAGRAGCSVLRTTSCAALITGMRRARSSKPLKNGWRVRTGTGAG